MWNKWLDIARTHEHHDGSHDAVTARLFASKVDVHAGRVTGFHTTIYVNQCADSDGTLDEYTSCVQTGVGLDEGMSN